ncbi:MAG: methyltransferase [Gemmatimonadaceae bacterium]
MTSAALPPTATRPARWATEPFTMGSPEQFARLRDWFLAVDYTEPALCAVAKVASIGEITALDSGRVAFDNFDNAQSLLVQLFIDGRHIPWDSVRAVLSPPELSMLTDLGLLQPSVADAGNCVGTIALFPSEDIFVASDRLTKMEVVGTGLPADLVYTPLTAEARRFVQLMPRLPCGDYLEMCAGTGIAALLAAKHFAGHAYSADITDRCTRFARFNAALNALANFTAVQGDLYEPVRGKQFDIITAHPPYVPAESTEMVFRDGGADGEQISRRVIAGVPEHLKPGGLFYVDCMMTDRVSDPIEQRMRRMLGPEEDEFDVLVFRSGVVDAKVYQAGALAAGRITPQAFARQREFFTRVGIERLVAIRAIIQRRTAPRPVVTRHHTLSDATRAEDLVWLARFSGEFLRWRGEDKRRLLDTRPRALPRTELRVRSELRDGIWTPTSTVVVATVPFAADAPCPSWFPEFLRRCDGRTTAGEHLARLRAEGVVPATISDEDFAELIRELADVPYIELDEFPLPGR